jgi:hypothetical protein
MAPPIRVATKIDGTIEAATYPPMHHRLEMDRQTGAVTYCTDKEGSDMFRWLVRAAREHRSV